MNPPFYRVAKAFTPTYRMRKNVALYHLVICLTCGHWRQVWTKTHTTALIGRLFSCKEVH